MIRPRSTLAALVLALLPAGAALAGPLELGGLIGPRRFSEQSTLGAHDPPQTSLGSTVVVGPRVGLRLWRWLAVEAELPLTPATTRTFDLGVFWMEPRAQLRFQVPSGWLHPFVVVGAGAPIALSSGKSVYPNGATAEGYGGGGVAFRPGRGVGLRFDFRVSIQPTRPTADLKVTAEAELLVGLWFEPGHKRASRVLAPVATPAQTDRDGDGVVDSLDQCPDRPEDVDGFEDQDGCPDIDDDGDLVLDIADKCPREPETFNGYDDEDGCPDSLGADVDGIIGTIEGLTYEPGETAVGKGGLPTLDMIATVLHKHDEIRMIIVGHTDDVEATAGLPAPAEGEPPLDAEGLANKLGEARAKAVRKELVSRGLGAARFVIESVGASEPVSDQTTRGRGRNRRVELKLFVPKRDH